MYAFPARVFLVYPCNKDHNAQFVGDHKTQNMLGGFVKVLILQFSKSFISVKKGKLKVPGEKVFNEA